VVNQTLTGENPVNRKYRNVTAEDMKRVTEQDFADLQRISRAYCRAVDATRPRKLMDGSASVARNGSAVYGTDDVSDDVTQDAVLIFAKRLGQIIETCEVSAVWVETREPSAWQYVRRDGETIIVTRNKIQYWSVRDAAARNGYRSDTKTEASHADPEKEITRTEKLAALAVAPHLAGHSAEIFRSAWGDGTDFPVLGGFIRNANKADDLGRAGIIGKTTQELYGGPLNSSSRVQRARDAGRKEWRALSAALDAAREELIYRSIQPQKDD